jgi:hypothetical protein
MWSDKEAVTVTACESEIKIRKQQFGTDAFRIMNQNLQAGSSTGGEVEPLLVEIFADAVTDVTFLIKKEQRTRELLVNVRKLGLTLSGAPMTLDDDYNGDDSAGNSCSSSLHSQQQAWRPRLPQWMGIKPKTWVNDDEANKLRSELSILSQAIRNRKRTFGDEIYDAMVSLGKDYRPIDCELADLLDATERDIQDLLDKIKVAKTAIEKRGSTVSHDELREFVYGQSIVNFQKKSAKMSHSVLHSNSSPVVPVTAHWRPA